MKNLVHAFVTEEDGATLIEYALIAALISVVSIAALRAVGINVRSVFEAVRDELASALA